MSKKEVSSTDELDEFMDKVKSRAAVVSSDVDTSEDEEVEQDTSYLSPLMKDNELFNVVNEIGG